MKKGDPLLENIPNLSGKFVSLTDLQLWFAHNYLIISNNNYAEKWEAQADAQIIIHNLFIIWPNNNKW